MSQSFPAIELNLPGGDFHASYDRVRADPRLGPALKNTLLNSLQKAGTVRERLQGFERGRLAAVGAYYQAAAAGAAYLTDAERGSTSIGPGPHPALDAFDRVAVDILDTWFMTMARLIVQCKLGLDERSRHLESLATLARTSTPWRPLAGELTSVGVSLIRNQLREDSRAD